MKQHLRIFMALLVFMICGGVSFGQTFKKVTSETELKAGDVIAIVNESASVALSTTQNSSNRGEQAITISNGEFSLVSGVQEISLEGETGKWSFNVGTAGYLYASSKSSNQLKTKTTFDENAQAAISFSNGDATIKFVGSNTRNLLKYNSSNKLFSCYASGQQAVQIYKKQEDGKTSTTLSFGTDYDGKTVSTKVGEILETPATLTPAVSGAIISYDSSDNTVAEIDKDGVVYAYKEGTTTITASYAGDDTYASSTVSYTLNVVDSRTATTLKFPNASYTFRKGDQNGIAVIEDNAAVLSPAVGDVTYSVSGTEGLAEVMEDGAVLINTNILGTATITASYAGDDTYKASMASYSIEVKALEEVFDFSKPEDYGYEKVTSDGITMPAGAEVKAGNVTLKVLKKGTSDASWWYNGVWRIYKNSEHELSVPDGYVITSVTIVSTSNTYAKYKIQGGALGKNWSGASQKVSIVNDPSGNSRITTITVQYAKCESLTTAASGFSTYAADYAVNYTEAGLKAYAVKVSDDKTKVAYTECTGVVPAGKAVLVKGTASTSYSLTPATEDADATFDTDLQISDGNVTADGITIFAFGTKNDVSGFKIVKSGVVIPEKKGYLVVANASAAKDFFAFEDSTNGIDDPTIEISEEEVPLFNLAGQRVGKDYKGIVVKNGKKYVNK